MEVKIRHTNTSELSWSRLHCSLLQSGRNVYCQNSMTLRVWKPDVHGCHQLAELL
jgi:hypothetical protein